MAFLGETQSVNHSTVLESLTHGSAQSNIQETTIEIKKLRDESLPLKVVKAKYVEEKLSGFVKDLKQRVDNTEVLFHHSNNIATSVRV